MIRQMVMVRTTTQMEQLMKVIGWMTCNTEREKRLGKTDHFLKEIIWKVKSMESVIIAGMTEVNTLEIGLKIKLMVMVHTLG